MAVVGEHLGMTLTVEDLDAENLAYFRYCARHQLHLQQGLRCNLLRWPPTTACPWTGDLEYRWVPVEGKGTVHAYTEVRQAIQPAFRPYVPYLVLLVELDVQKGRPTADEAIRMIGNLVTPDGRLAPPELVASVGIGSRVRLAFTDLADGLSLPNWTVDDAAPQPERPWRYPEA